MMVICDCQAAGCSRDALIALQGHLIAMLAVQNAALAGRVGSWRSGWRGWSVPHREIRQFLAAAVAG